MKVVGPRRQFQFARRAKRVCAGVALFSLAGFTIVATCSVHDEGLNQFIRLAGLPPIPGFLWSGSWMALTCLGLGSVIALPYLLVCGVKWMISPRAHESALEPGQYRRPLTPGKDA